VQAVVRHQANVAGTVMCVGGNAQWILLSGGLPVSLEGMKMAIGFNWLYKNQFAQS